MDIVLGNLKPENILIHQITSDTSLFKVSDYELDLGPNLIEMCYAASDCYNKSENISSATESYVIAVNDYKWTFYQTALIFISF